MPYEVLDMLISLGCYIPRKMSCYYSGSGLNGIREHYKNQSFLYSFICFSLKIFHQKLKTSSLLSYIWLKSNLKAILLVIETDTKYWVYSCYQSICLVSTGRVIAVYHIQYDMPFWKLLGYDIYIPPIQRI